MVELAVFSASVVLLGIAGGFLSLAEANYVISGRSGAPWRRTFGVLGWAGWLMLTAAAAIAEAWQVDRGNVLWILLVPIVPIAMFFFGLVCLLLLFWGSATLRIRSMFEMKAR